jgi:hypothetical protein
VDRVQAPVPGLPRRHLGVTLAGRAGRNLTLCG